MIQYHYYDDVSDRPIISNVPISSNGVTLRGVIDVPDKDDASDAARRLGELPLLIDKAQRQATGADAAQMWRYWNNVRVARMVIAGEASADVLTAFSAMLDENKLEFPVYYGDMTLKSFAESLIGLDDKFMVLGLNLESERIRRRRLLSSL